MKKFLVRLLSVVLIVGLFAGFAAASGTPAFSFQYYTEDGQPSGEEQPIDDLSPLTAGTTTYVKLFYTDANGQKTELGIDDVDSSDRNKVSPILTDSGIWKLLAGADGAVNLTLTTGSSTANTPILVSLPSGGGNPGSGDNNNQEGLYVRGTDWNNGAYENPDRTPQFFGRMSSDLGAVVQGYYYHYDGETYIPVTALTVSNSCINKVTHRDKNDKTYWALEYKQMGDVTVTYTYGEGDSAKTVEIPLTISLPKLGFYSSQTRSADTLISMIEWLNLSSKTLWFLREEGFTKEEIDAITVSASIDEQPVTGVTTNKVLRSGTEGAADAVYDLSITLPKPSADGYELTVSLPNQFQRRQWINEGQITGSCLKVGDYTVGFSFTEGSDIVVINEGNWVYDGFTDLPEKDPAQALRPWRAFTVSAGIKQIDSQNNIYHVLADPEDVQVTVNRMWIDTYEGDAGTFSLNSSGAQEITSGFVPMKLGNGTTYGTGITAFLKPSYAGKALFWANVSVTVNGKTTTGNVSIKANIPRIQDQVITHQPAAGTSDVLLDLQMMLNNLANGLNTAAKQQITIYLADRTYAGDLVLPQKFRSGNITLNLYGSQDGATVFCGGIDLNGVGVNKMEDIHFKAPDTPWWTEALYNGGVGSMFDCSFIGYDVALSSGREGMINPCGNNVFINNETAVLVDIDKLDKNIHRNSWSRNTFINNTVAIRVDSLCEFISAYYLRCSDSNFINNGTDVSASCGGTIYLYRNFYGEYAEGHRPAYGKAGKGHKDLLKLEALLTSKSESALKTNHVEACPAKTETTGTTVITNPRWKFPIKDWWGHKQSLNQLIWGDAPNRPALLTAAENNPEQEYTNILIADWKLKTHILNDEADQLKLDPSAFQDQGKKEIDVVDRNDTPLATWIFN